MATDFYQSGFHFFFRSLIGEEERRDKIEKAES